MLLGSWSNNEGGFKSSGYNVQNLSEGWHHIVAVGKYNSTYFYIDGQYVGTAPFKSESDIRSIGNHWGGGQQFGTVDEVKVYDTDLTDDQIQRKYLENGAGIISIIADDDSGQGPGLQPGDQIVILFNCETNAPNIDATNIDSVLSLDTHTWRDGSGNIGGAAWSTTLYNNDTLIITLSGELEPFTIDVGDSVNLYSNIVLNKYENPILSSAILIDLLDNLISYYTFEGNANDESGFGNDGIVYGASLSHDRNGYAEKAYSFDGNNDYIDIGNSSIFNIDDQITISSWIKTSQLSGPIISKWKSEGSYGSWVLSLSNGYPRFAVTGNGSDGSYYAISDTPIDSSSFHQVTGVYNSSDNIIRIYVDGILKGSAVGQPGSIFISDSRVFIGAQIYTNQAYLSGVIDDVKIYNRALSDAEIFTLFKNGLPIDTDNDGIPDGWEEEHGLNSYDPDDSYCDFDNDNLSNLEEYENKSNPRNWDTDNDGIPDGWEVYYDFNPSLIEQSIYTARMSNVDDVSTLYINDISLYKAKWGYDGVEPDWYYVAHRPGDSKDINITNDLVDGENSLRFTLWNEAVCCGATLNIEVKKDSQVVLTDSFYLSDSSSGIKYDETFSLTKVGYDSDNDGLDNLQEFQHRTDPNNPDTDGDGVPDGEEVAEGTDPLSISSSLISEIIDLTLSLGSRNTVLLQLENTRHQTDQFDLAVTGIDPAWYTLEQTHVNLSAGEIREIPLAIQAPAECGLTVFDYTIHVSAESPETGLVATGGADVSLQIVNAPIISGLAPKDGEILGTNTTQISWQTDGEASSDLYYRIVGQPDYTHISGEPGTSHQIGMDNLAWDTTFEWYVASNGPCDTAQSDVFKFTVQDGVVFEKRDVTFEIQRDYDQLISVAILNRDVASHTALLQVINLDEELIAGFVGSGSQDEVLTLAPGETAQVTLAVHAQDTTKDQYLLDLKLTADFETGNPIVDYTRANINICDPDINFSLVELDQNPAILTNTYRITNNGDIITDLGVFTDDAVASYFIFQPQIDHMRLETGQSIEFTATFQPTDTMLQFTGNLYAQGAGRTKSLAITIGCDAGASLYDVSLADVHACMQKASWYCTNRPVIYVNLDVPAGIELNDIDAARLYINFTNKVAFGDYKNHNVIVKLNDTDIASYINTIPTGAHAIDIPPSLLRTGNDSIGRNRITLETRHMNGGHYVIASDFQMILDLNTYSGGSVCAESQAAADQEALNLPFICDGVPAWQPVPQVSSVTALDENGNEKPWFSSGEIVQIRVALSNPDLEAHTCELSFTLDNDFDDGISILEQNRPFTLAPGASILMTFWWTAPEDATVGYYHTKIGLSCPGDELRERVFSNTLSVYQPVTGYQISPVSHDFGPVDTGAQATRIFTLTNTGDLAIDVGGVSLQGDADFSITEDVCLQSTIPQGNFCTFKVAFAPQTIGEKDSTVNVLVNEFQTNLPITGAGTTDDSDNDGMPDDWENRYGLNPHFDDSGEDPDGDNLINGDEYKFNTNPSNEDTDGDGGSDLLTGLAKHYSPIVYQHVDVSEEDSDGFNNGYADLIANFNYDGNWNGNEKWDNLKTFIQQDTTKASIYYSVVDATDYWFIYYAFYHPRDWTNLGGLYGDIFLSHENDMEAITLMVRKGAGFPGNVIASMSMSHNVWLEYAIGNEADLEPIHYEGDERGRSIGVQFKEAVTFQDPDTTKESIPDGYHPRVYVQSKGHGAFMDADSDLTLNIGATDPGGLLNDESIIDHWYLRGFPGGGEYPGDGGYNGTGVVYYCSYKDDGETVADLSSKIIENPDPESQLDEDAFTDKWIKYEMLPMPELWNKRFWVAGNLLGNDEMFATDDGGNSAFYGDDGENNAAHPPWTIPDHNLFGEYSGILKKTSSYSEILDPGEIFSDPLTAFPEHFKHTDDTPLDLSDQEYELNPYIADPIQADQDNDGMPDSWEIRYGLNPNVDDADDDLDGDGATNLEEYRHGTNPIVGGSVSVEFQDTDVIVSLTGDNQIFIEVDSSYLIPKAVQLEIIGLDPSWYTIANEDLNIVLLPFEKRRISIQLHLPENCDLSGEHPFEVSAYWSHGDDIASMTALSTLVITPDPNIYKLAIPEDSRLAGNSILVAWKTDIPTDSYLFYRKLGDEDYTQIDVGINAIEHRYTLPDLEWFAYYEFYTENHAVCDGFVKNGPYLVKTGKAVKFADGVNEFWIDRDYNQQVTLSITNTDLIDHTYQLSVINDNDDLVVGFVGDGSNGREASLQPGESIDVELVIHAPDTQKALYDIYLKIVSDEGEFDAFVDYSHAIIHVRPFVANLDLQPIASTPGMMTYSFTLINYGDTLTDIEVYVDDDSVLTTWMDQEYHQLRLENSQSVPVVIHAQEHTTGTLYARSGSYVVSAPFEIGCSDGTNLNTYTLNDVPIVTQIKDWYCTNKERLHLPFSVPPGFGINDILSAFVEVNFSLPMALDKYDPHTVEIYINDHLITRIEDTIPSGLYRFRFPASFIHTGLQAPAQNYLTLVAQGVSSGQYIVATDFNIVLNAAEMEIDLCVPPPEILCPLPQGCTPPDPETKIIEVGPKQKYRPGDSVPIFVTLQNDDNKVHQGTLNVTLKNNSFGGMVQEEILTADINIIGGEEVNVRLRISENQNYQIPEYADDIEYTISATFQNQTLNKTHQVLNKPAFWVRTPLVIVHGFKGSYLKKNGETIWIDSNKLLGVDFCDEWFSDLELADNNNVYVDEVIKSFRPFINTFQKLENSLVSQKYEVSSKIIQEKDIFYFAYDWRQDNRISASELKDFVVYVTTATNYDRVNVIAHSMGGLVAKEFLDKHLNELDLPDPINKIIFAGTPHLGSPDAFPALKHGFDVAAGFYTKHISNTIYFQAASKLRRYFDHIAEIASQLEGITDPSIDSLLFELESQTTNLEQEAPGFDVQCNNSELLIWLTSDLSRLLFEVAEALTETSAGDPNVIDNVMGLIRTSAALLSDLSYLYGLDMDLDLINDSIVKSISDDWPSLYELLPSNTYFSQYSHYYILEFSKNSSGQFNLNMP